MEGTMKSHHPLKGGGVTKLHHTQKNRGVSNAYRCGITKINFTFYGKNA